MEEGSACGSASVSAGEEAVADVDGIAIAPALETAHIVSAVGDGAAIKGLADVERRCQSVAHHTAAVVVVTAGGGDGDIGGHLAAVDSVGAAWTGEAHECGGMDGASDATRKDEVLDGGALDVTEERGALVLGIVDGDIQWNSPRTFVTDRPFT